MKSESRCLDHNCKNDLSIKHILQSQDLLQLQTFFYRFLEILKPHSSLRPHKTQRKRRVVICLH